MYAICAKYQFAKIKQLFPKNVNDAIGHAKYRAFTHLVKSLFCSLFFLVSLFYACDSIWAHSEPFTFHNMIHCVNFNFFLQTFLFFLNDDATKKLKKNECMIKYERKKSKNFFVIIYFYLVFCTCGQVD